MADGLLGEMGETVGIVGQRNENPDDPRCEQYRLGFPEVDFFFQDHQEIGQGKNNHGGVSDPTGRQVQRFCRGLRRQNRC